MDEISFQVRNIIVQEFSRVIASSGIPVLDMAANTADLGKLIASEISPTLESYGLTIPELYIENISLPPAVEAAMDKRTSMGLVGDLNAFTQYSAAEAMTTAASNPAGGGMAAGMGAGMGMALMNQGPWGAASARAAAAPTPPPPPVEHVWHVAENGATKGPFSKAALGRMAADGTLTRTTHVWTAGQDGWKMAEDVQELAQLFTILPPPPPGA
jgi:membrane protease subunit (stomatin/prohibitin family)